MAQMTESLARAILNGDGYTRNEVEQLCSHFLATPQPADVDVVDDAMVERACAAIDAFNRRDSEDQTPNDSWVSRPIIRAGLEAAIKGDSHAG